MKKFLFLTILLTNIVIFNACSSAVEQKNTASSGVSVAANATNQTAQTVPANTVNAESEKRSREVFNNPVNKNVATVNKNPDDAESKAYTEGRPAPDNSTFQSTMNAKGQPVETRTFKDHPQLAKVERVFITPNEKKILIYLKNGKVVEVADDQLPTFQTTVPGNDFKGGGRCSDRQFFANETDEKKNQQTPVN